jgi:hypothetical protein
MGDHHQINSNRPQFASSFRPLHLAFLGITGGKASICPSHIVQSNDGLSRFFRDKLVLHQHFLENEKISPPNKQDKIFYRAHYCKLVAQM